MSIKDYTKDYLKNYIQQKIVVCVNLLEQSIVETKSIANNDGRSDVLYRLEQLDPSIRQLKELLGELQTKVESDEIEEINKTLSLISHISDFVCSDMASIAEANTIKYLH